MFVISADSLEQRDLKQIMEQNNVIVVHNVAHKIINPKLLELKRIQQQYGDQIISPHLITYSSPTFQDFLNHQTTSQFSSQPLQQILLRDLVWYYNQKKTKIFEKSSASQNSLRKQLLQKIRTKSLKIDQEFSIFGSNILPYKKKKQFESIFDEFDKQYPQLSFKRDLLSKSILTDEIPGVNFPVIYLKEKGAVTGLHYQNLNLSSVNINLGKSSSYWYFLDSQNSKKLKDLYQKQFGRSYYNANQQYWPNKNFLKENQIEVLEIEQKSGDMIITCPGVPHWVYSMGRTIQVAWNNAPITSTQIRHIINRIEINKKSQYKNRSVIPGYFMLYKSLVDQQISSRLKKIGQFRLVKMFINYKINRQQLQRQYFIKELGEEHGIKCHDFLRQKTTFTRQSQYFCERCGYEFLSYFGIISFAQSISRLEMIDTFNCLMCCYELCRQKKIKIQFQKCQIRQIKYLDQKGKILSIKQIKDQQININFCSQYRLLLSCLQILSAKFFQQSSVSFVSKKNILELWKRIHKSIQGQFEIKASENKQLLRAISRQLSKCKKAVVKKQKIHGIKQNEDQIKQFFRLLHKNPIFRHEFVKELKKIIMNYHNGDKKSKSMNTMDEQIVLEESLN